MRARAYYIRDKMEACYPPFRYFGQAEDEHFDEIVTKRSMLEIVRRIFQQAFCIKSALGIQHKEQWENQMKSGSIPILETYGESMTVIPPGMTREQAEEQWKAELKRRRPEWYEGDMTEDATFEWSRRFGARLVFPSESGNSMSR
ncbi:MAG: hypothetical protein GY820_43265, partial [Gammaproteobacteria bacterium]|nr:hypothetical protein [Gammaproteobacteria bacterium]